MDPNTLPVVGVDAHLPALAAGALTAESLRDRFAGTLALSTELEGRPSNEAVAETGGFGEDRPTHPLRDAAVLIPLLRREQGLTVLLTRRTDHLTDHAGQISFPGGRLDPQDADACAAALREAHEEVGLPREAVEVIGRLPDHTTASAYRIAPIVGLVTPPVVLVPAAFEVAEVFEVPLSFLMDPAHHRRHAGLWQGMERRFLSLSWTPVSQGGRPRDYLIWGATAAMLRNLYAFLSS